MTSDAPTSKTPTRADRNVLVTGPSGAGRSTAIRALEDLGFETIDNLPLSMIPRLMEVPHVGRALALGVDTRNRDFSTQALVALVSDPEFPFELLYLDCSAEVLLRRYSETRRRHPQAPAEAPQAGIQRDYSLLEPVRSLADILIDTTDLTLHDLKAEIGRWYGGASADRLAVSIQSFSYKRGLPRGLDMVFDVRFLRNPYWDSALRDLDGRAEKVGAYIAEDPRFAPFFDKVADLAQLLLPAYVDEGKSHLSIGFGCTGGKHRSVYVSEKLLRQLENCGWHVSIRHRELERSTLSRRSVGETSTRGSAA